MAFTNTTVDFLSQFDMSLDTAAQFPFLVAILKSEIQHYYPRYKLVRYNCESQSVNSLLSNVLCNSASQACIDGRGGREGSHCQTDADRSAV